MTVNSCVKSNEIYTTRNGNAIGSKRSCARLESMKRNQVHTGYGLQAYIRNKVALNARSRGEGAKVRLQLGYARLAKYSRGQVYWQKANLAISWWSEEMEACQNREYRQLDSREAFSVRAARLQWAADASRDCPTAARTFWAQRDWAPYIYTDYVYTCARARSCNLQRQQPRRAYTACRYLQEELLAAFARPCLYTRLQKAR